MTGRIAVRGLALALDNGTILRIRRVGAATAAGWLTPALAAGDVTLDGISVAAAASR